MKDRTRSNVSTAMVLWASAMAVVLFLHEARWGDSAKVVWTGIGVTLLFGFYLGWRRRVAAVFVAPLVSWAFAWIPLWVAAMIRDGFVRGLFAGFFWITVGWVLIAALEFLGLFFSSLPVRWLRPNSRSGGPDVVVFGPNDERE
jgi:hypothetical protein